ncbi:ATP-binding protein [Methanolobus sp. ZRKC3]|uniref:ATP-binding protein n=1 Tax=Methanolobus sp. ZRKC3 TaxID=3125786 RepID=UPI00324D9259
MKIAIASGKGGTGKTTIAVNLALSLDNAQLLDCDVEEPNCNLFLGYETEEFENVTLPVPLINKEKCSVCGNCADFCQYNAIAALPSSIMTFPKLCHGCGGCALVCPENAIAEESRILGTIGRSVEGISSIDLWQGLLCIGEPMASPLIRHLQKHISEDGVSIIDSPPGTACQVIASISGMDFCVLVTEPTPFGLHDLTLAVELVKQLNIPCGVVINRCDLGDGQVEKYCISEDIPVLLKIPNEREIAVLYSKGIPFVTQMPEWKMEFVSMFDGICKYLSNMEVE